jgi:hypothetical protein
MIVPNSPAVEATLNFYGHLKTVTQVITYVGIAATASLSVFDLLYKQRSDPLEGETRYRLNEAGRTHLFTFLAISLITIASTIVKDYADHKLDAMAHEKAQAELRESLGVSLDEFTKTTMKPSLDKIGGTIKAESETLHTNIGDAVTSLNSALGKTKSDLQRSADETATEAEMASAPLSYFELKLSADGRRKPDPQAASERVNLWRQTATDEHCFNNRPSESEVYKACRTLVHSIRALEYVRTFVGLLDPEDNSNVDINIVMRSFLIGIGIPAKCDPMVYLKEHLKPYDCISVSDSSDTGEKTKVTILQSASNSEADMDLTISGLDASEPPAGPAPPKPLTPFVDRFGRDADILSVTLSVDDKSESFIKRLPPMLTVRQELMLAGGNRLTRTYQLRLSSRKVKGLGGLPDMAAGVYRRY